MVRSGGGALAEDFRRPGSKVSVSEKDLEQHLSCPAVVQSEAGALAPGFCKPARLASAS